MKLQKGHNLALAEGKGRNGFEKTRHYVIFLSYKSLDYDVGILFAKVPPFVSGTVLSPYFPLFMSLGQFYGIIGVVWIKYPFCLDERLEPFF